MSAATASNPNYRLLAAGLLGGLGVSMGAFGSHAFLAKMDVAQQRQYNVANQYHLMHSIAMMVVAVAGQVQRKQGNSKAADLFDKAYCCFITGTIVVATSRYVHCVVHKPDWLAYCAPVGGVILAAGWVYAALAGGQ